MLSLPRPESPTSNNPSGQPYHVLAAQGTNGITKKSKQNKKKESRNQRLRREKGLARAEANGDVLENKREKSKDKGRVIDQRRKAWDEIDGRVKGLKAKNNAFEGLGDEMDEEWLDEVDEQADQAGPGAENVQQITAEPEQPIVDTDVDEIT